MEADRVVLTSAIVTLGSTVSASVAPASLGGHGQFPHPRLLIGTALSFFGLSVLADIAPGIAAPLSAAVAITALTYYGIPILDNTFGNPDKVRSTPAVPAGKEDDPREGATYLGGDVPFITPFYTTK